MTKPLAALTDIVRAQEALRESESRLRAILNAAIDAIIVIDERGVIETFNPAAEQMFGYEAKEILGENIAQLMPAPFREQHDHYLRHYLATDERKIIGIGREVIGQRKDNTTFPMELTVSEVKLGQKRWFTGIIRDISERKREKNRYLQKTSEMQAIFDAFPDLFFRLDSDGTILDYHAGQMSRLQLPMEKMIGRKLPDIFPPKAGQQYQRAIAHIVQTGTPIGIESHVELDQRGIIFEARLVPYLKKQVIVIVRDITERKQAEESLQNSELRYQALAELLPVGIFRCDATGRFIYTNERWLEIASLTSEQALGHGWLTSIHPDDRAQISDLWSKSLLTHQVFKAEFRFRHEDGVVAWVFGQAVVELDSSGVATGYIGTITDITDRIKADEALRKAHLELEMRVEERTADLRATNRWLRQMVTERKQAENALREERNFISAILETAGALVVVYDAAGNIIRFNRGCQETTGYAFEDVKGSQPWNRLGLAEETADVRAVFEELARGASRNEHEHHWRRRDGESRLIAWSNTVIRDDNNAVKYIISTGIDITDRRKAEEEARQHQAELVHVSRLSTMGEMATGLAHELNQPLAAIVSYTQGCVRRIAAGNNNPRELIDAMQQVTKQAQRAGEIIRRMRNFVSKGETQRVSVHVNDILREVLGIAKSEIRKQNVHLRAQLAEQLPPVQVDMIQVEQVLLNLVRNAVEAMNSTDENARELAFETSLTSDGMVQVAIRDSGEGLPMENPDKVFDPFFTTKSTGMGMGLAISKSLIEAHGGRLWATRNPSRGTTFHFTLPT